MMELARRYRVELLDLNVGSEAEVRKCLADIERINLLMGWTASLCSAVWKMIENHRLSRAVVLDVGTGSGEIPRRLLQQAKARGFDLEIVALDSNPRHLKVAREKLAAEPRASLLQGNAFTLPVEDRSVDIVISSLLLHHFQPPEVCVLLRECSRVARTGWIMQDVARHALALYGFRLFRPLLATSYLTRHDAEAAIRKSYTWSELSKIAGEVPGAALQPRIFSHLVTRDITSQYGQVIP